MNAIPAVLYLVVVAWAIAESAKRLMTVLWILVSLAAVVGLMWVLSLIWTFGAEVVAHVTVIVALLISAFVGVSHMRAHRRGPAPGAAKAGK